MSGSSLTQPLRRNAELFPLRVATAMEGRRTTWRDTLERVSRLAGAFRDAGISHGDRVAILALNSDRYIEVLYATLWAGCVSVPLNTRWTQAELKFAVRDCEPALLLYCDHFTDDVAALGMPQSSLIPIAGDPRRAGCLESLIEASSPLADRSTSGDDLAIIFYTGGTTGESKGVMLSHANLVGNFLMHHAIVRYPADSVLLHVAPMFHLADACVLFGMTTLGATHVVVPTFDPEAVIHTIETEGVTATLLVPTMMAMLIEAAKRNGRTITELRNILYGASPITEAVLSDALSVFPNARFAQAYGQTEASPVATILEHEDHRQGLLRSAGRPIPGVDLRIVDADSRDVVIGEVGEIWLRGPNVMLGYWRRPTISSSTVVDGWLKTGDAGYRDADGFLFLVDRVKDMIISGGENVYSAEVENALMSHPAILQCAVIGIPDAKWGEAVHAFVRLRPGVRANAEALRAHSQELIASFKCPRSFTFVTEPLPLSGAGKILKTELRRQWRTMNAEA